MPRRFHREVILIGLMAILFVQLCPLFEDPTPLTKVRQPFAPIVVLFLLLSLQWLLRLVTTRDDDAALEPAVPLVDLTCARLC